MLGFAVRNLRQIGGFERTLAPDAVDRRAIILLIIEHVDVHMRKCVVPAPARNERHELTFNKIGADSNELFFERREIFPTQSGLFSEWEQQDLQEERLGIVRMGVNKPHAVCGKTPQFSALPYACPEPALAKRSALCKNGCKKACRFPHRGQSSSRGCGGQSAAALASALDTGSTRPGLGRPCGSASRRRP